MVMFQEQRGIGRKQAINYMQDSIDTLKAG